MWYTQPHFAPKWQTARVCYLNPKASSSTNSFPTRKNQPHFIIIQRLRSIKYNFIWKKNRSNRNTESASETTTADAVSLQRMAICFPQFRAIPSKYHQIAIRIPFPIAGPSSRPPFDCRGLSIKSEKLPQIGPGQDWQRRPFLPTHTQAPRGARSQHSKRPISTAFSRRKTSRPAGEWRRQPPYHGALIRNAVDTRQFRKSCLLRVRRVQR